MKDKTMYFLYTENGKEWKGSAIGIQELARILKRTPGSVRRSIKNIEQRRKDFILKDKDKNKYLIMSEEELQTGVLINERRKRKRTNKKTK